MDFEVTDGITPELDQLVKQIGDTRAITAACGKRLEKELRDHFAALDKRPNSMGWPKRHFWNRQVRSRIALSSITETTATVTISSPELIHRIQGGTIRPKRGKTLARPANAAAYKAGSPREANIDQLDYIPLNRGNLVGALILRFQSIIKRTKKGTTGKMIGGDVWYWLVRSVTTKPHPEDLPSENLLAAAVKEEAHKVIVRKLHIR